MNTHVHFEDAEKVCVFSFSSLRSCFYVSVRTPHQSVVKNHLIVVDLRHTTSPEQQHRTFSHLTKNNARKREIPQATLRTPLIQQLSEAASHQFIEVYERSCIDSSLKVHHSISVRLRSLNLFFFIHSDADQLLRLESSPVT